MISPIFSTYIKPASNKDFSSIFMFLGLDLRFAIWRPVRIQVTSLLAVFLASLLDLKDKTCSIFWLGPGILLSGSKQTNNY